MSIRTSTNASTRNQAKKQWGSEKSTKPLSTIHDKPSTKKITLSRLAIVSTILLWSVYFISTIVRQFFEGPQTFQFTMQAISYLIVVTLLTFSALMYLLARQGAFLRFAKHMRVPRAEIDNYFSNTQPTITVLIPSYSEEPQVIYKTLMSAALQEYPHINIVLLLDDNPFPKTLNAYNRLNETRKLGQDIMNVFSEPYTKVSGKFKSFEHRNKYNKIINSKAIKEIIEQYEWSINWLKKLAEQEKIEDHVDIFFKEQVLSGLAQELELVKNALIASYKENATIPSDRAIQLYRRLTWIFSVKIDTFERKKYASLSHEANKAMNLNSYIGLMGGTFMQRETPDGIVLAPTNKRTKETVKINDSDYLLTLDADSILLRDYCLRLVYFLEQPNNANVAVTQTPYSSFRGASTRIERLAAATTDIQHILHQGMSQYGATFWVGANAVIRKKALEDIVQTEWIGGFEIRKYIQDRTVIEDTESSIDLTLHGWSLVNYPERLSYSATPPDFGSLIVQRRRWANGGLLILPKLWSQTKERKRRNEYVSTTEILLRVNYMASITWACFGLIFLLAYPYNGRLLSPFVLLAALPYFLAMASDLKYCGYKRSDVLRIYGFNLILLPVNLAGVLKSIQQALSGKKIPFARTPKVKNRTLSPLIFILAPLSIVAFSSFILWRDEITRNWGNAAFAGFNAIVSVWAIIAYIGILNALKDIWHGLTKWMYVEVKPKQTIKKQDEPLLDWRAVIYHGDDKTPVPVNQVNYDYSTTQSYTEKAYLS